MTISNFFVPNRQTVTAITNANPAVVTTSQSHGYDSGLIVRFFFPLNVGMNNLNGQNFKITTLSNNTFSIPVNSTNFDVFNPIGTKQVSQVIPVGNVSLNLLQPEDNNNNIIPET